MIIHTEKDKFLTAMNVKTILNQLPAQQFVRVSKSYIINANHIEQISHDTIFINNQEIPLSKSYKDEFFANFIVDKLLKR